VTTHLLPHADTRAPHGDARRGAIQPTVSVDRRPISTSQKVYA
jgi:hypothetical protein